MSYLIVNIIYRTLLAYLSFYMWVLFSVDPASYLLPFHPHPRNNPQNPQEPQVKNIFSNLRLENLEILFFNFR